MNGKRKALLIGINYQGSSAALRGCWNDVQNVKSFISTRGYKEEGELRSRVEELRRCETVLG